MTSGANPSIRDSSLCLTPLEMAQDKHNNQISGTFNRPCNHAIAKGCHDNTQYCRRGGQNPQKDAERQDSWERCHPNWISPSTMGQLFTRCAPLYWRRSRWRPTTTITEHRLSKIEDRIVVTDFRPISLLEPLYKTGCQSASKWNEAISTWFNTHILDWLHLQTLHFCNVILTFDCTDLALGSQWNIILFLYWLWQRIWHS